MTLNNEKDLDNFVYSGEIQDPLLKFRYLFPFYRMQIDQYCKVLNKVEKDAFSLKLDDPNIIPIENLKKQIC